MSHPSTPAFLLLLALAMPTLAADGELRRSAYLGAAVGPVEAADRDRLGLAGEGGITILGVLPGTPGEAAGLKDGDVLLSADDAPIRSATEFIATVARRRAGDRLTLVLANDAGRSHKEVILRGRPPETSAVHRVEYGAVRSRGHRLRTILTIPPVRGRLPALFLIQGIGMSSVDSPAGPIAAYRAILDDFSRRGWITLRVEKPGVGDSEGGPPDLVDFEAELDGYRQGLMMLKSLDAVDPSQVVIFGHSMGGVMAPLLAAETPVAGLAVYGTIAKTWQEYILENFRRQDTLDGLDAAAIDGRLRLQATFQHRLCDDRMTPAAIAAAEPSLRELVARVSPDGVTVFGRHHRFYSQLASRNLGEAWSGLDGHALAIWGRGDFVSSEADHVLIVDAVNRRHPGRGTLAVLDASHGFAPASSYRSARLADPRATDFEPTVLATLAAWAERIAREP